MNPESQTRLEKIKAHPIDGIALKKLVEAGLTWLRANQQTVNSLNVFPFPDGDTGTNMGHWPRTRSPHRRTPL